MRPTVGEAPIGSGGEARFTLWAEGSDEADRLLQAHPALLDTTLGRPPHEGGVWLARPDGYVVAVATAGKAEAAIGGWLERFQCATSL